MSSFLVGGQARISVVFTVLGVATDPTNVRAIVKPPTGTAVAYIYGTDAEVVKTATGAYYINQSLSLAGTWGVAWEGTGAVVAVAETTVRVDARQVVAP